MRKAFVVLLIVGSLVTRSSGSGAGEHATVTVPLRSAKLIGAWGSPDQCDIVMKAIVYSRDALLIIKHNDRRLVSSDGACNYNPTASTGGWLVYTRRDLSSTDMPALLVGSLR